MTERKVDELSSSLSIIDAGVLVERIKTILFHHEKEADHDKILLASQLCREYSTVFNSKLAEDVKKYSKVDFDWWEFLLCIKDIGHQFLHHQHTFGYLLLFSPDNKYYLPTVQRLEERLVNMLKRVKWSLTFDEIETIHKSIFKITLSSIFKKLNIDHPEAFVRKIPGVLHDLANRKRNGRHINMKVYFVDTLETYYEARKKYASSSSLFPISSSNMMTKKSTSGGLANALNTPRHDTRSSLVSFNALKPGNSTLRTIATTSNSILLPIRRYYNEISESTQADSPLPVLTIPSSSSSSSSSSSMVLTSVSTLDIAPTLPSPNAIGTSGAMQVDVTEDTDDPSLESLAEEYTEESRTKEMSDAILHTTIKPDEDMSVKLSKAEEPLLWPATSELNPMDVETADAVATISETQLHHIRSPNHAPNSKIFTFQDIYVQLIQLIEENAPRIISSSGATSMNQLEELVNNYTQALSAAQLASKYLDVFSSSLELNVQRCCKKMTISQSSKADWWLLLMNTLSLSSRLQCYYINHEYNNAEKVLFYLVPSQGDSRFMTDIPTDIHILLTCRLVYPFAITLDEFYLLYRRLYSFVSTNDPIYNPEFLKDKLSAMPSIVNTCTAVFLDDDDDDQNEFNDTDDHALEEVNELIREYSVNVPLMEKVLKQKLRLQSKRMLNSNNKASNIVAAIDENLKLDSITSTSSSGTTVVDASEKRTQDAAVQTENPLTCDNNTNTDKVEVQDSGTIPFQFLETNDMEVQTFSEVVESGVTKSIQDDTKPTADMACQAQSMEVISLDASIHLATNSFHPDQSRAGPLKSLLLSKKRQLDLESKNESLVSNINNGEISKNQESYHSIDGDNANLSVYYDEPTLDTGEQSSMDSTIVTENFQSNADSFILSNQDEMNCYYVLSTLKRNRETDESSLGNGDMVNNDKWNENFRESRRAEDSEENTFMPEEIDTLIEIEIEKAQRKKQRTIASEFYEEDAEIIDFDDHPTVTECAILAAPETIETKDSISNVFMDTEIEQTIPHKDFYDSLDDEVEIVVRSNRTWNFSSSVTENSKDPNSLSHIDYTIDNIPPTADEMLFTSENIVTVAEDSVSSNQKEPTKLIKIARYVEAESTRAIEDISNIDLKKLQQMQLDVVRIISSQPNKLWTIEEIETIYNEEISPIKILQAFTLLCYSLGMEKEVLIKSIPEVCYHPKSTSLQSYFIYKPIEPSSRDMMKSVKKVSISSHPDEVFYIPLDEDKDRTFEKKRPFDKTYKEKYPKQHKQSYDEGSSPRSPRFGLLRQHSDDSWNSFDSSQPTFSPVQNDDEFFPSNENAVIVSIQKQMKIFIGEKTQENLLKVRQIIDEQLPHIQNDEEILLILKFSKEHKFAISKESFSLMMKQVRMVLSSGNVLRYFSYLKVLDQNYFMEEFIHRFQLWSETSPDNMIMILKQLGHFSKAEKEILERYQRHLQHIIERNVYMKFSSEQFGRSLEALRGISKRSDMDFNRILSTIINRLDCTEMEMLRNLVDLSDINQERIEKQLISAIKGIAHYLHSLPSRKVESTNFEICERGIITHPDYRDLYKLFYWFGVNLLLLLQSKSALKEREQNRELIQELLSLMKKFSTDNDSIAFLFHAFTKYAHDYELQTKDEMFAIFEVLKSFSNLTAMNVDVADFLGLFVTTSLRQAKEKNFLDAFYEHDKKKFHALLIEVRCAMKSISGKDRQVRVFMNEMLPVLLKDNKLSKIWSLEDVGRSYFGLSQMKIPGTCCENMTLDEINTFNRQIDEVSKISFRKIEPFMSDSFLKYLARFLVEVAEEDQLFLFVIAECMSAFNNYITHQKEQNNNNGKWNISFHKIADLVHSIRYKINSLPGGFWKVLRMIVKEFKRPNVAELSTIIATFEYIGIPNHSMIATFEFIMNNPSMSTGIQSFHSLKNSATSHPLQILLNLFNGHSQFAAYNLINSKTMSRKLLHEMVNMLQVAVKDEIEKNESTPTSLTATSSYTLETTYGYHMQILQSFAFSRLLVDNLDSILIPCEVNDDMSNKLPAEQGNVFLFGYSFKPDDAIHFLHQISGLFPYLICQIDSRHSTKAHEALIVCLKKGFQRIEKACSSNTQPMHEMLQHAEEQRSICAVQQYESLIKLLKTWRTSRGTSKNEIASGNTTTSSVTSKLSAKTMMTEGEYAIEILYQLRFLFPSNYSHVVHARERYIPIVLNDSHCCRFLSLLIVLATAEIETVINGTLPEHVRYYQQILSFIRYFETFYDTTAPRTASMTTNTTTTTTTPLSSLIASTNGTKGNVNTVLSMTGGFEYEFPWNGDCCRIKRKDLLPFVKKLVVDRVSRYFEVLLVQSGKENTSNVFASKDVTTLFREYLAVALMTGRGRGSVVKEEAAAASRSTREELIFTNILQRHYNTAQSMSSAALSYTILDIPPDITTRYKQALWWIRIEDMFLDVLIKNLPAGYKSTLSTRSIVRSYPSLIAIELLPQPLNQTTNRTRHHHSQLHWIGGDYAQTMWTRKTNEPSSSSSSQPLPFMLLIDLIPSAYLLEGQSLLSAEYDAKDVMIDQLHVFYIIGKIDVSAASIPSSVLNDVTTNAASKEESAIVSQIITSFTQTICSLLQ